MVVRFSGTTNINRWMSAWKKRVATLHRKNKLTPKMVAEFTAKYAKTIAPKDTGALVQSIAWKTKDSNNKKAEAFVWVRHVQNPKIKGIHGRTDWYAAKMHGLRRSGAFWGGFVPHSGDRYFMFTARDRAKEKFRARVKINIKNFVR